MSYRGSFVTSYIYCEKCLEEVSKILICNQKYLCSQTIDSWENCGVDKLPIIAGKIGGLAEGEEIEAFEFDFIPKLEKVICHPMQIAVIPDSDCDAVVFNVGGSDV